MNPTMDIIWSPYEENLFARLASDIVTLYQVENYPHRPLTPQSVMLSNNTHASPLATANAPVFVHTLDWCPTQEFGRLLAAGTANGKVSIVGFQDYSSRESFRSLQNKEFSPRHQRSCNHVAWNPSDCNFLAAGFDRHRVDAGLIIYDVFSPTYDFSMGSADKRKEDGRGEGDGRGLVEFAGGEQVVSCSWFKASSKTLLGALHGKGLRIFDLREPSKQSRGPVTKHVYGACIDPFGELRIASFSELQLCIWDLRNFEKPVVNHEMPKVINQIRWSPTRYGMLALTVRDSSEFRLLDVQNAHMSHEEYEPVIQERTINGTEGKVVAAFSWHPTQENRALLLASTNSIFDVRVLERITLNWSKTGHLLWACGREMHYFTDQSAPEPVIRAINEDISVRMKLRAVNEYGMKNESFVDNIPLLAGDSEPEPLWKWLEHIRCTEGFDGLDGISFRGIRNILFGKVRGESARAENMIWDGPQQATKEGVSIFVSVDREHALRLCGWSTNRDNTVDTLTKEERFERAAAICVFHMNLTKAIEIFQLGAKNSTSKNSYNIIAVALSGFTEEQPSMWRSLCAMIITEIEDPYIRNSFLFLSANRSEVALKRIAADESLVLEDRIAFACTYFSDQRLMEFLRELTDGFVAKGLLAGLALTGFGLEGIELVQSYVDRTSDVQTASLLSSIVTTKEWVEDPRPYHWVDHYREVLDSWMFWDARAIFDVHNSRIKGGGPRIPRQVLAICTFCAKTISHSSGTQSMSARGDRLFVRTPDVSAIQRVMTCPSCGKSLPRCSLCQIGMGTPTNMGFVTGEVDDESVKKATKINPLEKWFTWCQTCRHGGHASHLADWFKWVSIICMYGPHESGYPNIIVHRDHAECPVTGCSCKCMMIESGCATISNNRRRIATSN